MFLQNDRDALQQQLQREREDRLRVELTGPRGVLVHFEGSMKDGVRSNFSDDGEVIPSWIVRLDLRIPNFIDTVAGLELRVGGNVVFRFDDALIFITAPARQAGFDLARVDQPQIAIIRYLSPDVIVAVRVGPIVYQNYINLFGPNRPMAVPDFVRFWRDHRTNNPNDNVLLQDLNVEVVHFCKNSIPGTMSVLQSMGLSTE